MAYSIYGKSGVTGVTEHLNPIPVWQCGTKYKYLINIILPSPFLFGILTGTGVFNATGICNQYRLFVNNGEK
jgi:hypothetical protein